MNSLQEVLNAAGLYEAHGMDLLVLHMLLIPRTLTIFL